MADVDPGVTPADQPQLSFLAGGGEMGALIRAFDWSSTPLGAPETWPQSLRTAIRIMLTSRQPIWIGWGSALIYLYNDAYKSIIGGKHPWALGRPASEVWSELWPEIGPMLATAMGGVEGTYVEEQLLIMERNGYPEETYYTFSYSPIPDDDGHPGGIICANTDDTQRVIGKRQLALLRDLAAGVADARHWRDVCRYSAAAMAKAAYDLPFVLLYMQDSDPDGLTLIAAEGFIHDHDHPAMPRIDEWRAPDPVKDHAPRLVEALPPSISGLLAPGVWHEAPSRAAILDIPAIGETGRSGVMVVGLNPYRLFDDSYGGFLSLIAGQIAAAVADADAFQEERRRAEALAELDRAKTAFFSNVSHEFRTPLTLMLGPLEDALELRDDPELVRANVELAHRNGLRLLRLVNSLLDFSRLEAGRVQANFEPTDLARFTADIASSFRSAIEKAGLTLDIQAPPLPAPAYVDRDMWEKVVLNLLSNALKFTLEGTIAVTVKATPNTGRAVIEISDTGIGIPSEEIPKLFERFHRVEGAQGRSFEGSGIGLALVHELIKLHGGEIAARSEPGVGSCFTLTLPLGRAHLPADRVRDSDRPATGALPVTRVQQFVEEALHWLPEVASASQSKPPASVDEIQETIISAGQNKSVLLADDNADMRNYVSRLLVGQGYQVTAVADGESALIAARQAPPDLILTDVMMPRLDGFRLLKAIRADPVLAGVPVLLLSARAGEEAKVEGLEAGADDYLIKPFAARELLARINVNIQMAEVRRQANRAVFESEQRLSMSQDRLSIALSTGRVAVFEWEVESDKVAVLGPLSEIFGLDAHAAANAGLPLDVFMQAVHAEDRERVVTAIRRSASDGGAYEAEYRVTGTGEERSVVARGQTGRSASGGVRLAGVIMDISDRLNAQRALQDESRALQILNRAAAAMAGDLDLERVVQSVVDAGVEVTGAAFGAFFYNQVDENGERYRLYALSGAPRESFAAFDMPRNTALFEPTFAGRGVVRFDDVTAEADYGRSAPHHGMPKGHLPVRSYLAAPVRSRSGEVLGALFFGHPQPGVFTIRAEERVAGLASQAAVAMDNASLFQAARQELDRRRSAETALQALNATLEERVLTEVAERAKAEDALRQAQKMEAVGQLTGGVAHDFNNLLTIIIGGLERIQRNPGDQARALRAVEMALSGAQRAASLTARLLAFARRQPLAPKVLELNLLVRDMGELMHRTLGETIELESVLAPRLWAVEADQNQLESALLNLAVNARDAMPEGGKLTIETANTALDEAYTFTDAEVIPGQYVMIAVSDTGVGMSPETLSRVFEPFFTTKEVGRGTGLGLSQVYGFVKQSGGHVGVYSEEGQGTTVKLYFPRFVGPDADAALGADEAGPVGGDGEIVLVVEDNDDVRAHSVMILSELGYGILEAAEAEAALAILRSNQHIDLLFTDVVLPGKSGRVLADAAAELRPNLKILFTTGYSRNAIVHHGRLDQGVQLITKPFSFQQLATRVREIMDQ